VHLAAPTAYVLSREAPHQASRRRCWHPPELFYGIPTDAFRYFGDDPRTGQEVTRHHRWVAAVRTAGYTVSGIRQAAETDPGYQAHLQHQRRKARIVAPEPLTLV
jgi:hypothetical protein